MHDSNQVLAVALRTMHVLPLGGRWCRRRVPAEWPSSVRMGSSFHEQTGLGLTTRVSTENPVSTENSHRDGPQRVPTESSRIIGAN